jgi:hypothetical protein
LGVELPVPLWIFVWGVKDRMVEKWIRHSNYATAPLTKQVETRFTRWWKNSLEICLARWCGAVGRES